MTQNFRENKTMNSITLSQTITISEVVISSTP